MARNILSRALPFLAAVVSSSTLAAPATQGAPPAPVVQAPAPPQVLWEIGKLDDKPADLALGAREELAKFSERFPADVRFVVGKSDPASDFAYIHPGPQDAWAGSKPHVVAIAFDLAGEPSGTCVLVVGLCRSHYGYPPVLAVSANGRKVEDVPTARDGRNQTYYVRIAAEILQRGSNEIRIDNSTGSWAVYDGLRLERYPPGASVERIAAVLLRDTPYLREVDGKLHQVLHVQAAGMWDGKGTFRLRSGGSEREYRAEDVLLRKGLYELSIPIPEGPVTYECGLVTAAGQHASNAVQVTPHRKWTIHVAMKTHYDLGYTHPVDEMLRNAAGPMLDRVLEHAAATRGFAPEHRFRWIYPTWVLRKIREMLPEAGRARLDEAIARGEVGWNAAPFSLHSYFCGIEDAVRAFYPSVELDARYGRDVRWAKQTDVPGHTRFLPQVLARSGIRLLQIGGNFGVRGERTPLLFWWQAPDGSRVLTQLTDGYGWGFDEARLLSLERDPSYPFDAFLALYVTGDNVGPADLVEVSRTAKALAERYAYPRLRIGSVEEFADAIEARFADKVPVVKAELTDWWIHGVASMARETSLARQARERLPAAEKLWSLAGIAGSPLPYPGAAFGEAYEQSLLFSEHTWGVSGFKPMPQPPGKKDLETNEDPGYKQMRRSWEVKGDYARAAWKIADRTSRDGLEALAAASGAPQGAVFVFNPLNWARSDLVRIAKGESGGPPRAVRDLATGAEVPWQLDGDDVVFLAKDVPPVGHAVFSLEAAAAGSPRPAPPREPSRGVIENARYRISLDETSGAVKSLVDISSGEELVDPDAPHFLGQYVYEGTGPIAGAGWHGSPWTGKGTGRLVPRIVRTRVEEGPVFTRFTAEGSLPIEGFPVEIGSVERVVETITLPRDLDWIECEVRLQGKRPTALAEQGNIAFPFRVKEGRFRLELLGSVVDPAADLQEGGNHDAFAVQHWVDVSGPAGGAARGITWSPVDTTIVTLGDLRLFRWDAAYQPGNTRIYANGLNNGWSTNFQEWQGGDFRFRFRFRSHAGGWLEGGAARFGRETAQPLLAARVAAAGGVAAMAACRASHLRVDARHVVLINLKRAEDGDGYVLRLFNTASQPDSARISFPSRRILSAERVAATEKPLAAQAGGAAAPAAPLEVKDGAIQLKPGPFALETVRVRI